MVVVDPGRAPVTLGGGNPDFPAWAPDDRRLALMTEYDGGATAA